MKTRNRKRLMADWKFQGGICIRFAIYWFVCYVLTVATIYGLATLEGTAESAEPVNRFFTPALLVVTLVLPLAMLEILAFTNKFAGPLVNFRRRFRQLAEGQTPGEMQFRTDDLLKDFDENFNIVRNRLLKSGESSVTPDENPVSLSTSSD